ncbi:unnamed protein product [Rotaria magnacalcarata]|uniref:DUF4371 domain-containing protein n=1 Tax=Rotaria magnacalcarata TaxID=392030 RepID=A0A8S3CXY7_9BILA|nr:unnamed protein product [Rotaria magnacalcarata]
MHEDCLGFYELESQHAKHITTVILDVLARCNLNVEACRGQPYDGAATMSGVHGGVVLKPLCPTLWTARVSFMNSLLANYHLVQFVIQELVEQKGEFGIKATDWLNQVENFQSFFGLKLDRTSILKLSTKSEVLTDESCLPRVRRTPNRLVTDTILIPEVSENCTKL